MKWRPFGRDDLHVLRGDRRCLLRKGCRVMGQNCGRQCKQHRNSDIAERTAVDHPNLHFASREEVPAHLPFRRTIRLLVPYVSVS